MEEPGRLRLWWYASPNWARFLLVFPAVLVLTGGIGGASGVLLPSVPAPVVAAGAPSTTTAPPAVSAPVTSAVPTTEPTSKPPARPKTAVLGALCAPPGATGVTKARKTLVCVRGKDGRARWRAV